MLNLASQDNIDDEKMLKLEEAVKQLKEENERLKKNAKEKTPIRSGWFLVFLSRVVMTLY